MTGCTERHSPRSGSDAAGEGHEGATKVAL